MLTMIVSTCNHKIHYYVNIVVNVAKGFLIHTYIHFFPATLLYLSLDKEAQKFANFYLTAVYVCGATFNFSPDFFIQAMFLKMVFLQVNKKGIILIICSFY